MTLARRSFLRVAAGAAVLPIAVQSASAQTYPARPITMIVPFAPGGPTSVVYIENRPGADGLIGTVAFTGMRDDHALL